jgi:hypothetical protein
MTSARRVARGWTVGAASLAGISLLAAMWGGLIRIGWAWPVGRPATVAEHGALMVMGFLGTLISLERAVALSKPWAYAGPYLTAAGALWLLAGGPTPVAQALMLGGGLVLLAIFVVLVRADPEPHMLVMALGALSWPIGAAWWLTGEAFAHVLPWFVGFVVLTIVGERLELSRISRPKRAARAVLTAAVVVLFMGELIAVSDTGWRLIGLGMLVMALWLLGFDVARRRVRSEGLPRYSAVALLGGFVWLAVAGLFWVIYAASPPIGGYDAMVHALFIGFAMSMIFAHAAIIAPALLGRSLRWTSWFWLPLVLLWGSLVLRLGGDLSSHLTWSRWGGLMSAVAILLFLATAVIAARTPRALPATTEA